MPTVPAPLAAAAPSTPSVPSMVRRLIVSGFRADIERILHPANVEQRALVRRALAEIRVARRAQHVDRRPSGLARGPLPGNEHDARTDFIGDPEPHAHFAE